MKRHLIAPAATATAGLVILTACGSSGNNASAAAAPTAGMTHSMPATTDTAAAEVHNTADVTFATEMIPHHSQAVEMANEAMTKATFTQVKTFAQQIKSAQEPEINEMSGWLTAWKQPVPTASAAAMGGMAMTGTGMMSDADMAGLAKADGPAFDRMWVSMMIQHHQGAVTMAQTELAHGQNPGPKKLAQSIITSQTEQITQLKALLTQLPS